MTLNRRQFLQLGSAAIAAGCLPASAWAGDPGAGKRRPNLVFLFADQMRADAMGCAGDSYALTPNMDRLAATGVMATNAVSTCPVCTPYRGQLITGRYGHQTGILKNDDRLGDDEVVISEAFKRGGYTTGYIGKWHLTGNRKDPVDAASRRGWDFWAVRNCSHDHFEPEYWLNDAKKPVRVQGWEPDVQTDLATEFIKQKRDEPFSLFVSYGPPHDPYKAPAKYEQIMKKRKGRRGRNSSYYAMITSLDDCLPRIEQALQEAGIADDTILIFTSDHGDLLGDHGFKDKRYPWRGSTDVPFIAKWPNGLPAGQRYEAPMSSIDLMPTLLGLCGVGIPNTVAGIDISEALRAGKGGREEVLMAHYRPDGLYCPPWRGLRTPRWHYAYHGDGDWILYDVQKDPNERHNLAEDPQYAEVCADLRKRTDALRREAGDDMKVWSPNYQKMEKRRSKRRGRR